MRKPGVSAISWILCYEIRTKWRYGPKRRSREGGLCFTGICMIARQDAGKSCSEIVTKLRTHIFLYKFITGQWRSLL